MGWMLRTFRDRHKDTIMTLYRSLILPHLEYNSILTYPVLMKDISLIEGVQRSVTSKIHCIKHLDYWERLEALQIFSMERRRERYTIIYVWQIIEGHVPNLPKNPIVAYTHSRRGRLCKVPPIKKKATTKVRNIRERFISVEGPKLFNIIPAGLRNATGITTETFKHRLDRFLHSIDDKPTVPGYSGRRSQNSKFSQGHDPTQKGLIPDWT